MGSSASKPLKDLSKDEISQAIATLGESYEMYCDVFIGNGLDGRVLDNLDENEIQETLDDLEITNRLHRRVLVKELDKAKTSLDYNSTYYDYSPGTKVNELEPFRAITNTIFRENQNTACMAGVHLVLDNGNQLALDTKLLNGGQVVTQPLNLAKGNNICGGLVQDGSNQSYYKIQVPKNVQENLFEDPSPPMTYTGHILKNESGKRVGMVCMIDNCSPSGVQDLDRENFLRRMAIETEYQLNLRRQLIERWRTLTVQMSEHQSGGQITDSVDRSVKMKESHKLPVFQDMANEIESAHLPLNFYDLVDELSAPRPPIAKDDMERCAVVEAMGLADIASDDELSLQLQSILKEATEAFGFPYGEITAHNHENQFCIAGYDESQEVSNTLKKLHQSFRCNVDGTQFTRRTPRGPAISNYPIASGQTFVVEDINADETFKWLTAIVPLGSYVSTPIKDAFGRVIAVLCLFDSNPRSSFNVSQQKQTEQFGDSIAQSIESWIVKRSRDRVENGRKMINRGIDKTGIPKRNVTMVLTDIQGSTALWESNSVAMQDAHDLHNDIIRKLCAEHLGYEIETEGDSFALAFHDPVDAFAFALKTQTALFEADWPDGLLQQPEAKEEIGAFRGLRVRMAIHHGVVGMCEDLVSERVNYSGETMNLTKALASMAQGGQILTTSEAWEVASGCIGSTVDMPHVDDLGCHVVLKGKTTRDGVIAVRLMQLVPANLACDSSSERKVGEEDIDLMSSRCGRQFPPISSLKKISPWL
jgi:class 3 adenylate cyclase/GAF domain-containing protein